MNIVLLGGPGAGKGTQAEKIGKKFGTTHLSTGDILREEVDEGTELGKEAKEYMDRGDLVPDRLILDMIEENTDPREESYLFDGFPRNEDQAEALSDYLDLDLVVYIEVSEEEVVRRLSSRRICSDCGKIYNTLFKKPEKEGVCDECGGDLYRREDDEPEVIRDRYSTFIEETSPLIDYYEEKGLLAKVDGEKSPEEVFDSVRKEIEELGGTV